MKELPPRPKSIDSPRIEQLEQESAQFLLQLVDAQIGLAQTQEEQADLLLTLVMKGAI